MTDETQKTEGHYEHEGVPYVEVGKVTGRTVKLDDVRAISVGRSELGNVVLAFDGPTGKRLMFAISADAHAALVALLNNPDQGDPFVWERATKERFTWRMIVDDPNISP